MMIPNKRLVANFSRIETRTPIDIKFGGLYIIDATGEGTVVKDPTEKFTTSGFGISNKVTAMPILFRKKASSSGANAVENPKEFQYWLPGTGIIDPPVPPNELYVWFQIGSKTDKDGYKIDDQSTKFLVPFEAGEKDKTIWYSDTGDFSLVAPT
jgi:hypothetical protein